MCEGVQGEGVCVRVCRRECVCEGVQGEGVCVRVCRESVWVC